MKAPEKLYLRKRNKLPLEVVRDEWYEKDPQSLYGSVEYLRTDAFIEKAAEWLEDNAIEYWGTEAVDNGMMIDDFKKAMKL